MRVRLPSLGLVICIGCSGLSHNARVPEQGQGSAVYSTDRNPGRIAGVVLETQSLRGVHGAQIIVNDSLIATTDAAGWFDLELLEAPRFRLVAQSLGYTRDSVNFVAEDGRGFNARLMLGVRGLDACGLPGAESDPGTLFLRIHDVATGRSPHGPVRITVAGPGGTRGTVVGGAEGESAFIELPLRAKGRYSVHVSGVGYEDWFHPGIALSTDDSCAGMIVWLLNRDT